MPEQSAPHPPQQAQSEALQAWAQREQAQAWVVAQAQAAARRAAPAARVRSARARSTAPQAPAALHRLGRQAPDAAPPEQRQDAPAPPASTGLHARACSTWATGGGRGSRPDRSWGIRIDAVRDDRFASRPGILRNQESFSIDKFHVLGKRPAAQRAKPTGGKRRAAVVASMSA